MAGTSSPFKSRRLEVFSDAPAWLVAVTLLASCHPASVETIESVGPDGWYSATLEVKDRGSCCHPSAKVTLHDLQGRIGRGDLQVFKGIGGWPIEIQWIGPSEMVVVFCKGNRFEVRSHTFEEKLMGQTLASSQFTVQVATSPSTLIAGKAYCNFA